MLTIQLRSRVEQLVAKADISKQEIQEILACIFRILANKKYKKPRYILFPLGIPTVHFAKVFKQLVSLGMKLFELNDYLWFCQLFDPDLIS